MASKYSEPNVAVQVIAAIYENPSLLEDKKYDFNEKDFTERLHQIVFGSIYNLYQQGATDITAITVNDYLKTREKAYAEYKAYKGDEWLDELKKIANLGSFNYYYTRLKKFTLLRVFDELGVDVKDIYDPDNIFDKKKRKEQEDWLDNATLEEIGLIVKDKIERVVMLYAEGNDHEGSNAAEGLEDLLANLEENPDFGIPMYGRLMNTFTRGARLKKVYLRSAATNVGKTRAMIADACSFAFTKAYDKNKGEWVYLGPAEPTLFVATEQELGEIQTMLLAFIANVSERHINENSYEEGEKERIREAVQVIKEGKLIIKELPDFSLGDIESTIKRNVREHGVKYVCFDYLHTSLKILTEISQNTGVKGLREDSILFLISVKLKDLANQYGIFILTATQLNADYKSAKVPDQNLLRGAKSIADKVDVGMIMLDVTEEDLKALKPILDKNGFDTPNMKISLYKNRSNEYKGIFIWCKSDKGTCRIINPIFVTDYFYELIDVEDTIINVRAGGA